MIVYLIISLLLISTSILSLLFYRKIKALQSEVKALSKMQNDHNIVICKLMFHKAQDLEEYETCAMIKRTLPKINMNKIFE